METVLLQVVHGRLGNSRKADKGCVETETDKDMLKLRKILLDCVELKNIVSFDSKTSSWLRDRSVPALFKDGVYAVKAECTSEIDAMLQTRSTRRGVLVERLYIMYDVRKREAQDRLKGMFSEKDYPPKDRITALFSLTWRFFALETPTTLNEFSPTLFEAEDQKRRQLFEDIKREGVSYVRLGFKTLIDHLINRLKPDLNGDKKVFKKNSIDNIKEFIATFPFKDIGGDEALQVELDRITKILSGLDPQDLRDSDSIRDYVVEGFTGVAKNMESLMESGPKRKILI